MRFFLPSEFLPNQKTNRNCVKCALYVGKCALLSELNVCIFISVFLTAIYVCKMCALKWVKTALLSELNVSFFISQYL